MDIKVKTQTGEMVDIEVQLNNSDNFRKRSLYYWSKLYGETIEQGEAYESLKKSIVVNILDFNIIDETDKYHSVFKIKEKDNNFDFLDDLEIHYVELQKFDDMKNIDNMDSLELWLTFIKDAGNEQKEDIVNKIRSKEEVIEMAGKILEELSADEIARQYYLASILYPIRWTIQEKGIA